MLERIRIHAEAKLKELEGLAKEVNGALAFDPTEAGVLLPATPKVLTGDWQATKAALLDTADTWTRNTRRLIARKAYQHEGLDQ